MERKEYFKYLILIFGVVIAHAVSANNATRLKIYEAYIQGDMAAWKVVMDSLETQKGKQPTGQQLGLVNYYYGYIGWAIGNGRKAEAKQYISKMELLLNHVLKDNPQDAEAWAYKSALMGFKIGVSNFKAVFLGRKSRQYLEKSLELNPNNTQGILEKGNMNFYMPAVFGGDKTLALAMYRQAAQQLEQAGEGHKNWMYLNVLTLIGAAYEKLGDLGKAEVTYKKILQIEPGFLWVKNELYPALEKKISGTI